MPSPPLLELGISNCLHVRTEDTEHEGFPLNWLTFDRRKLAPHLVFSNRIHNFIKHPRFADVLFVISYTATNLRIRNVAPVSACGCAIIERACGVHARFDDVRGGHVDYLPP